jgi:DNA-binding ferritin-like protein
MQSRLDDSASKLAAQAAQSQAQLQSALTARDTEHAAQLDAMQTRVKDLLSKKESVITTIKEQLRLTQQELDSQRREIMENL